MGSPPSQVPGGGPRGNHSVADRMTTQRWGQGGKKIEIAHQSFGAPGVGVYNIDSKMPSVTSFSTPSKAGRQEGPKRRREFVQGPRLSSQHLFLIIKVTDDGFRELGASVTIRHRGKISHEPTRRPRACVGVMLRVDTPGVFLSQKPCCENVSLAR